MIMPNYLFNSVFEFQDTSVVDWFTLVVLTVTLIILYCYTCYTRELQITAKEQIYQLINQRELSMLPSIIHWVKNLRGPNQRCFYVENIGNGPAINISLKIPALRSNSNVFAIMRGEIAVLKPGQKHLEFIDFYEDDKKIIEPEKIITLLEDLSPVPRNRDRDIELLFQFQNIESSIYQQKNLIDSTGYIHGFPKKLIQ